MIARYEGTCINCKGPIKKGQQIEGKTRAYYHADCEQPDTGAKVTAIENPQLPASEKQIKFINTLFAERGFTIGEASVLIDFLLAKPRQERNAA
jgi:hypothetical protein